MKSLQKDDAFYAVYSYMNRYCKQLILTFS